MKKYSEGEGYKLKIKLVKAASYSGSITSMDIANQIKEQTKARCRQEIVLIKPIKKEIGEHG